MTLTDADLLDFFKTINATLKELNARMTVLENRLPPNLMPYYQQGLPRCTCGYEGQQRPVCPVHFIGANQ